MMNAGTDRMGDDPWSTLLEQAHGALTGLRAEDLEKLADTAQCMLTATLADDSLHQRTGVQESLQLNVMARKQKQLRDLLIATDDNLKVLRRMQISEPVTSLWGEVDSRWVR